MRDSTGPEPAPVRPRLKAFLLDFLVVGAYLSALAALGIAALFTGRPLMPAGLSPVAMDLAVFLLTVLPVILYFSIQEGGRRHATWGKRRAGVRVCGVAGGGGPGPLRALARSAVKFAPWQLAHTSLMHIPGWPLSPEAPGPWVMLGLVSAQVLVLVYVIMIVVTRSHRTLHDLASGTMVVEAGRQERR